MDAAPCTPPPPSGSTHATKEQSLAIASIPRFFFPRRRTPFTCGERIRRGRVAARLDAVVLTSDELSQLVEQICAFAYTPVLAPSLKREAKDRAHFTGIVAADQLLESQRALLLSYADYRSVSRGGWTQSLALKDKLSVLLPAQRFLMDSTGKVDGYALLQYLYALQLSLRVARFVLERVTPIGTHSTDSNDERTLSEEEYVALITELIRGSTHELGLQDDADFAHYYELICTRMLLLPQSEHRTRTHGLSPHGVVACERFTEFFRLVDDALRGHFDASSNAFHPERLRFVHRQYLQLDRDGNGLLSAEELRDYGKKRAFNPTGNQPTHDLTDAFVTQLFAEVPTFDGQLDYRGFLDFTLRMRDTTSSATLRFFWSVLDLQKQGFLDAFTLDYFLRSLVAKICVHDGDDDTPSVERLRTQVFDAVAPANPTRITWQDLQRCKLGHAVVRFVTDYVAYRTYEDSGGRFGS